MVSPERYGVWASVIGGAEGLGKAFAENLASRGFNLLLIDKKLEELTETTGEISSKFKVEVQKLHLDVNSEGSADIIMESFRTHKCRFFVYNASYGPVRPFLSNSAEQLDSYFNVNIRTTVSLVHQFIDYWQGDNKGILLLSSLAGFRGTQLVIPYAASKAYLWNFSEGLYYEFKNELDISVCCPGTTDTPGYMSTNPGTTPGAGKPMKPEKVAGEALNKFGKKLFIIPGFRNKLIHFLFNRVFPHSFSSKVHNDGMVRIYPGMK